MTREENQRFTKLEGSIAKLQEGLTKFSTSFEAEFGSHDREGNLTRQLRVIHKLISEVKNDADDESKLFHKILNNPKDGHSVRLSALESKVAGLEGSKDKKDKRMWAVGLTFLTVFGFIVVDLISRVMTWIGNLINP